MKKLVLKHKLNFIDKELSKIKNDNLHRKLQYGKEQGVNIYLVAKDRLESQVSGTKVRNYALAGDFDRVK